MIHLEWYKQLTWLPKCSAPIITNTFVTDDYPKRSKAKKIVCRLFGHLDIKSVLSFNLHNENKLFVIRCEFCGTELKRIAKDTP